MIVVLAFCGILADFHSVNEGVVVIARLPRS